MLNHLNAWKSLRGNYYSDLFIYIFTVIYSPINFHCCYHGFTRVLCIDAAAMAEWLRLDSHMNGLPFKFTCCNVQQGNLFSLFSVLSP